MLFFTFPIEADCPPKRKTDLTLTIAVFPTPGAPRTTTFMSGRLTSSSNLGLGAPAGEPPQVLPGPPLPLPPPGARPEGPPGLKLPASRETGGPVDKINS